MESVSSNFNGAQLRGSGITLKKIIAPTVVTNRRTKIVCTLGPACWDVDQLEELIDAGMSVARFNFSHGDHDGHAACLGRLRKAAKNKGKHVAVLLDTKGPEIRSGFFAHGAKKVILTRGEKLTLTTDYDYLGDDTKLACSYKSLPTSVTPGQKILCADGSLVLTVISCHPEVGEVITEIDNSCSIGERKNMNLPGVVVDLPTLTVKDIDDIKNWGCKHGVDFIAASFVRKAKDVTMIREVLGEEHKDIKIICKIENLEGLENYDEILDATDGIMVARGDLGMEIPPEKVFLAQKMMIRQANIAGKYVVTATQMLESMITNPRPTRAECSDVANAVLDGTDCVMLSGETANGEYPKEAVEIMARTCYEAETALNHDGLYQAVRNSKMAKYGILSYPESVASSSVKTAIDIEAKCIICCSETGDTARQISNFRAGMPVYVLTTSERTARQCYGVLKGCRSRVVESEDDYEVKIKETIEWLKKKGVLKDMDPVVIVHGNYTGAGSTNTMRIEHA